MSNWVKNAEGMVEFNHHKQSVPRFTMCKTCAKTHHFLAIAPQKTSPLSQL